MFEHIDSKKGENEERDINLLPQDLRSKHKKKKKKDLSKPSQADFNIPKESVKPIKPKPIKPIRAPRPKRPSAIGKFFSRFKSKFKKKSHNPDSILAINLPGKKEVKPKPSPEEDNSALAEKKTKEETSHPEPLSFDKFAPDLGKSSVQSPAEPSSDKPIEFSIVMEKEKRVNKKDKNKEVEVNLMPAIIRRLSVKQALVYYLIAVVISVVIITIPYIYFQTKKLSYTRQINNLNEQLVIANKKAKESEEKISNFGSIAKKIELLEKIFADHIYWSKFFIVLEEHTLPRVYFTQLSANPDLSISVSGKAMDLKTLAEQLVVLRQSEDFQSVSLGSLNLNVSESGLEGEPDGIDFTLSFFLDSSIINYHN